MAKAKKEKAPESKPEKRKKQLFLPDGSGGDLAPASIPEIDDAAEAARKQKAKLKKANEELVALNVALALVMERHRDDVGDEYIYEDDANVRRFVKFGKARVVMGKVKKTKPSTRADAHGIVSGASAAETAL